jgi:hypothetical protein
MLYCTRDRNLWMVFELKKTDEYKKRVQNYKEFITATKREDN